MYAIVQQGTKQFEVEQGKTYQFDRMLGKAGDEISFKEVLLVVDTKKCHIGTPYVSGAEVSGKIVREAKGKKVISFKFKRRKGSKVKKGHRQKYTLVEITNMKVEK
ncbi:MAG: 50S ribosomal protein L21 [Candidatus Omnitrophica bacterium]|nr:50S ribosomal protein L21 [Candidatus Omnitrophota bacterium]